MNRREALRNISWTAALFGLPASAADTGATPLPPTNLFDKQPERYWAQMRKKQFTLPGWRAFLNNGSLGVAPRPVLKAVTDYLDRSAALLMDEYPRWGYETLDEYREEFAAFTGCRKDELAFTHCATEAMSIIAGGMPLKAGDEVVITDQEHPSGRCPWELRQARDSIKVRVVNLPIPPESSEQLADVVLSAIGPKTRVISFSGITTRTGLIMPIQQICDAAREKGVISVVDGAHMNGQISFRLSDLHCDYFAGSPHKWLFAPAGCGLLYLREDRIDEHFPIIATAQWDDKELKAARYMRVGTNNRAIFEGMMAGLRFARDIGPERIHSRIHDLSKQVRERAAALPYLELLTPPDDSLYGSLVTVRLKLKDPKRLWALCKERKIYTTQGNPLRISTHIHTRPSDLDLFFETLDEAARA
jgi:selenocysteine lyase/cysteine desulfurase